jgi:non-heme chloroperoxidase
VVAIDLRGHGNSSKILSGHTIRQYGCDVRQVIEHLGLEDATLVGWSLGGAVVLSYYQQFSKDSRLKALGLVDSCVFPFSAAEWNNHVLRDNNFDRMHLTFALYTADPRKFASDFRDRMLRQRLPTSETDWVIGK